MAIIKDKRVLEFKLKGLEKEKSALDLCRSRINEEILVLIRSI
jgi:hypothetical protein